MSHIASTIFNDIETQYRPLKYKATICLSHLKHACHIIDIKHIASDTCSYETIKESKELFLHACEDGIYDGWTMYFERHGSTSPAHTKIRYFPDVLLVALLRGYALEEHYNRGTAPCFDSQKITDLILTLQRIPHDHKMTAIEYCRRFIDSYGIQEPLDMDGLSTIK